MSRFAVRALIALFTSVVFLLIQSVFWSTAVSAAIAGMVLCVTVVAYFRPHNALLVLAALAPLGSVWVPLFGVLGVRMRGAEALVLAFLAGALLRGWTLHRFRSVPLDRLRIAALVFGLIVSLSCMQQLSASSAGTRDLLDYVTRRYLTSFSGFGVIFDAMLLIEGLALLWYTSHYCRTQAGFAWRLVRMLIVGAGAATAVNVWFFAHELIETGNAEAHFLDFLLARRWSAHVGDANAAGSYFAMAALISFGLALKDRAHRTAWATAGSVIGLAMWMTASRTAIIAVLLVGVVYLARVTVARSSLRQIAALAIAASALLAVLGPQNLLIRASNASPSQAVNIRWMFLATTWRMVGANPLLGVGIGQYARWSTRFSSPELLAIYPRENAHNNFAQVAGELGLVGLAAFLAVLVIGLWPPAGRRDRNPVVAPVLLGLAAFIVSWLGDIRCWYRKSRTRSGSRSELFLAHVWQTSRLMTKGSLNRPVKAADDDLRPGDGGGRLNGG